MSTSSFSSFADASKIAKRMAKERNATYRVVRCGDSFIVEGILPADTMGRVEPKAEPTPNPPSLANSSSPSQEASSHNVITETKASAKFVPYLDGRKRQVTSPPDNPEPEPTARYNLGPASSTIKKPTRHQEVEALRKKLQATSIKSRKPTAKSQIGEYSGGWVSMKQGATRIGDTVARSYVDEGIGGTRDANRTMRSQLSSDMRKRGKGK